MIVRRRNRARAARRVCLATLVLMAALPAQARPSAQLPTIPTVQRDSSVRVGPFTPSWVEALKAVAWPVAALLLAGTLRAPFGRFLEAIGPRITKLSAFRIELELEAGARPTSALLLDEIRAVAGPAPVADSSAALNIAIQDTTPADYALIIIGEGREWLTSRLFIAASLMERMRGVRCFVFVESRGDVNRRFLALAPSSAVRWRLATRYPWLEVAYTAAAASAMTAAVGAAGPQSILESRRVILSDQGTLEPSAAEALVLNFITSLQLWVPPADPSTWTGFDNGKWERAQWVTHDLLRELLPEAAFDQWIREDRDGDRTKRAKPVLNREGEFVAIVDDEKRFKRLISRGAILEELAKRYEA